jgi:hypothetical protein
MRVCDSRHGVDRRQACRGIPHAYRTTTATGRGPDSACRGAVICGEGWTAISERDREDAEEYRNTMETMRPSGRGTARHPRA